MPYYSVAKWLLSTWSTRIPFCKSNGSFLAVSGYQCQLEGLYPISYWQSLYVVSTTIDLVYTYRNKVEILQVLFLDSTLFSTEMESYL